MGSFFNVVIYRLPLMLKGEHLNLCYPGSHCPVCKHVLSKRHNIPLVSFLLYKGKCAFCNEKISVQYPLVEFLTAILLVGGGIVLGDDWYALSGWFIFSSVLLILGFIDFNTKLLPDGLVLPLAALGIIFNYFDGFVPFWDACIFGFGCYVLFSVFSTLYYTIRGYSGLGGGDVKLFAAIGCWLGHGIFDIIILSLTLTLISVWWFRKPHIPFDSKHVIPLGPGIVCSVYIYCIYIYACNGTNILQMVM